MKPKSKKKKSLTFDQLKTVVSKRLNEPKRKILIGDLEHRENYNGKNLEPGYPVYIKDNLGVNGAPGLEFAGWIINDRYYKENRG